jgi:hypothetical protein
MGNPSSWVMGTTSAISKLACFRYFSASGNCADLPACGLWMTIAIGGLGKSVFPLQVYLALENI